VNEGEAREPLGRFAWLVRGCNSVASLWIVVLMLLIVADVTLRFLFNRPIVGVNEVLEISIVAMLYMQVTEALREGRHTRSDAFTLQLQRRRPRAAAVLDAVFHAAGFVLMVIIIFAVWPRLRESYSSNLTIGNRGVFVVPEWPLRAVILAGCMLMAIQFAAIVVKLVRRLRAGPLSP
jgi:TRAP-type mannitol/chloroaromatic compound transport system permease small subunit